MLDIEFAELLVRSADAVVGLLFKAHLKGKRSQPVERMQYGDHEDFDDWIDGAYAPFEVLDVPLIASEALFRTDQNAYRSALIDFIAERDAIRRKIVQILRAKT
jgi:hypothetical protein